MTEKEIEFMEFMEKTVLPNRRSVSYDTLLHAGSLVGISINTSCRSCAQKSGADLLNRYGQLKPAYLEYKKIKEVIVNPKPEEPIQLEEPKEDITTEPGDFTQEIAPNEYKQLEEKPKQFPIKKNNKKK